MAEPSSTAAGVSLGVASGLVSALLLALGLSGQLIVWAMIGCVIGATWAPPTSRFRARALFLCSTLACAKVGAAAAEHWYSGTQQAAGGICVLLGIFFHPLLAAVIKRLPALLERKPTP